MPDAGFSFNSLIESLSAIGSASSNLADLALTGAQTKVRPRIDYGLFSKHVFFGNAVRKFRNSLKRIEDSYPVGLSAGDVASLCAENVYKVDQWKKESSGFDLWLLDQLSLTGSITSSATNTFGETVALTNVDRDATNNITGTQTATVDSISARAEDFEQLNIEMVPKSSGSSNDHFEWGGTAEKSISRGSKLKTLVPDILFDGDEQEYLERTLQAFGDQLDDLKGFTDQLSHIKHVSYDEIDRVPNKFLPVLAAHFGITLYQSAVNTAVESFFIESVSGLTNQAIASEVWNRILNNLIYLLKNKGTRETIEAIGRIHGIDHNFLKVDENALLSGPRKMKVRSEVDVPVLFSTGDVYVQMPTGTVSALDFSKSANFTIQARISATGAFEHKILVHPLYSIKMDASGQIHFTTTAGTTASTTQSSISSYIQKKDNFINIVASRTGDNLKLWALGLSGSGSGGDDVVVLASGTTGGVLEYNFDSSGGASAFGAYFPGSGSFSGYIHEVRAWNVALEEEDLKEHTRNFESTSFINSTASNSAGFSSLSAHWKLKESRVLGGGINFIVDSTTASNTATPVNFANQSTKRYRVFQNQQKFTHWYPVSLTPDNDKVRQGTDDEKFMSDPGTMSVHLTPIEAINRDIRNTYQNFNVMELMGQPDELYFPSYSGNLHETLIDVYSRYPASSMANLNTFVDAIDSFNDSMGSIFPFVKQFFPAKSHIISEGMLVEPHILHRSKNLREPYDITKVAVTSHTINNHYLELDTTAASATTTASFQGYQYRNGLQSFLNNSISSRQAISTLSNTEGDSINAPRFADTRVGRFIPAIVVPSRPDDTELEVTLNRFDLVPTAGTSASNANIDGTIRLLRNGKPFRTAAPAIKLEFPTSADGTNLFKAVVGDIDNDKGRVIEGKDFEFTTKIESNDIQVKLQLASVITSGTGTPDSEGLSGEVGIVRINATNLFNNSTRVIHIAIGHSQGLIDQLSKQSGITINS